MASLNGFLAPRTPSGASALVPDMPWFYSGTLLTAEYRTDPANVAALLPEGVELAGLDGRPQDIGGAHLTLSQGVTRLPSARSSSLEMNPAMPMLIIPTTICS